MGRDGVVADGGRGAGDEPGRRSARELFLEGEPVPARVVRPPILNSWQRSRLWGVDTDRIETPYNPDLDPHSKLSAAAGPVLDRLAATLADSPMSLILTDAKSRIRERRVGNRDLSGHLDAISLAPGFSYAEEFVGTNGIGTAIEDGRTACVFGPEHFSERLQRVSCAAAPIRNPTSGRIIGLVDLTSWRATASPLMVALVEEAAADIEGRLLDLATLRERALLDAFVTGRRGPGRLLVAVADDCFMADAAASELLGPADHRLLRERAAGLARGGAADLQLQDGRSVLARARPVEAPGTGGNAGYVVEIQVLPARAPEATAPPAPPQVRLPGLAGRSPAWRSVVQRLTTLAAAGRWTLLRGEQGTGKLALVRAVHRQQLTGRRLTVHDCAQAGRGTAAWLRGVARALDTDGADTVVLRHLDALPDTAVAALDGLLRAAADRPGWVVALSAPRDPAADADPRPARNFLSEATLPPLRLRPDDVAPLVPVLLARHAGGSDVQCSEQALRTLARANWPGNVRQLEGSLRYALAHHSGPWIEETDLPPSLLSHAQHPLTAWEQTERDMIVQALLDNGGDKSKAAKALGISRATMYRKITGYQISIGGPGSAG
ncbi:sigma-54-dependent Fis family transcriptional regulator [Streptomyces tremellae]|uniref:Helix-turn-helix domain-containing protein n=1 Tax=Streptomyces tremellae TaxID=1124239 RepID=A0ABP7EA72_9ACTN